MRTTARPTPPDLDLSNADLAALEPVIVEELAKAVDFSSASLLFPRSMPDSPPWDDIRQGKTAWLAPEKRLLIPLAVNDRLAAVLSAKDVRLTAPKAAPRFLTALAAQVVDKLLLIKACTTDRTTGAANHDRLMDLISGQTGPADEDLRTSGQARGHFGLLLINLDSLDGLRENLGLRPARAALKAAVDAVREDAPPEAVTARPRRDQLAVFWPGATQGRCRELARKLARKLARTRCQDPILEQEFDIDASIGFAAFPQDINGPEHQLPSEDQAEIMLKKAQKAARIAREHGPGQVYGFSRILAEGGSILRTLPLDRLSISLGTSVNAREGQRFMVWGNGDQAMVKGEIAIIDAGRESSLAEIMQLADPAWPIGPGDRLTLAPSLPETKDNAKTQPAKTGKDRLTGLMTHRDFMQFLAGAAREHQTFTLALVHVPEQAPDRASHLSEQAEGRIRDAAVAAAAAFGPKATGGRYSMGGLIYLLPDTNGKKARKQALALAAALDPGDGENGHPAIGLAPHPFLSYARSDTLANCRKALEYAKLLPSPHVGLLDSLALTIHADNLFSQGRTFEAVAEYELALTADKTNNLARNSLGVCMARNNDFARARQHFKAAAESDPKDLNARYNHGYACLRLGQLEKAAQAFRQCLELDEKHLYSLIRLGQIAQRRRHYAKALEHFEHAAALDGGHGLTQRYMARLALARKKIDKAREHLHQALLHDPKDAASLNLMAQIYLEQGEDAEVAEALARQSTAISPWHKPFWHTLAQALTAQDKHRQAADALARAQG